MIPAFSNIFREEKDVAFQKFLEEGGIIFLHDCLPRSLFEQAVPRSQHIWTGDVWKAIVDLRQNDNLEIYTCEIDQGIGVIENKIISQPLKISKPINKIKCLI